MFRIRINAESLKMTLKKRIRQLQNLNPLLKKIGGKIAGYIRGYFIQQTGPDGVKWKPSMRAIMQNGQTLSDTGMLKNGIHFNEPEGNRIFCGTSPAQKAYARVMHFGGTWTISPGSKGFLAWKNPFFGATSPGKAKKAGLRQWIFTRKPIRITIPARPYMGLRENHKIEILDMVGRYLGIGVSEV